ncbi:hypothetical protein WJX72_008072 [[Myrmecia] bisecta]|uniref:EF-hand domain-containing protein n=1 Tax=[Myrmecia] bisecta TaxID=41462 RepID=A0AAW1Q625_9CHLO
MVDSQALPRVQIAIVVYVLVNIFQRQGYLQTEVPSGVVTSFARGGNYSTADLQQQLELGHFPYCTNPDSYNFYFDSATTYENFSCVYQPTGANAIKGFNSMFYTTYLAEQKSVLVRRPSAADCPAGSAVLPGATLTGYLADACMYKRKRHFMTMAVENAVLRVVHTYSTSIVGVSGSLPRTIVRRAGSAKNLLDLPANTVLQMPVQQWLELAGVDLDLPTNLQPGVKQPATSNALLVGQSYSANTYPKVRVSGVEIIVNLKYYNYKLEPNRESSGSNKNNVICIMELEPRLQWTTSGSDVRYMMDTPNAPVLLALNHDSLVSTPAAANGSVFSFVKEAYSNESATATTSSTDLYKQGVMFTFKQAGVLGRFNLQNLINALVQGSVLLSVAHVVVTLIALYGMGMRSQLYGEFMCEKVNYKREYARFASQALVASHVFKLFDKDGSGELDRAELFVRLKDVMGKRLADDKLAVLTEFLCNTADDDEPSKLTGPTGPEGAVYNENAINMDEWIAIFTDEKASVESLVRIVDHECKKDPEVDRAAKLERIKAKSDTLQGQGQPGTQDGKPPGQSGVASLPVYLEASSINYAV